MATVKKALVAYEYRIVSGASPFASANPTVAAQTAREQAIFFMRPYVLAGWEPISIGGGGVDAPEKDATSPTGGVCCFVLMRRKLAKPLPAGPEPNDTFHAP